MAVVDVVVAALDPQVVALDPVVALGQLVVALDRLVAASVPVVECRAAGHRGQTPVVRPPLARPAAAGPRNCRAADLPWAADQTSAVGKAVGRTSAVGQPSYREVVDRPSAVDLHNCRREELASVAGAGGRFRRCRRTVRT